jgi:hypothetical protein
MWDSNLKELLLRCLEISDFQHSDIICAKVSLPMSDDEGSVLFKKDIKSHLKIGFTKDDYDSFLSDIDISIYTNDLEMADGTVWLKDGSILELYFNEGTEWPYVNHIYWSRIIIPEIPDYLK